MPRRPRKKQSKAQKVEDGLENDLEQSQLNATKTTKTTNSSMKMKKKAKKAKKAEKVPVQQVVQGSSSEDEKEKVVDMSDNESQEQGPVFIPKYTSSRDRAIAFMNKWNLEYGTVGEHVELAPGNIEEVKDKCLVIDITSKFDTRPTNDFVTREFTHHIDFQNAPREIGDILAGVDFDNERFIYYMVTRGTLGEKTLLKALKLCFQNLRDELEQSDVTEVALPLIGANNEDRIRFPELAKLINSVFDGSDIKLTFYFQERTLHPPRVPGQIRFPLNDVPVDEGYQGPPPEIAKRLKVQPKKQKSNNEL